MGRRGDPVGQMEKNIPVTRHECVFTTRSPTGTLEAESQGLISSSQKPTGQDCGMMPVSQCQHTDSGNSANTQSPLVSRELKRVHH